MNRITVVTLAIIIKTRGIADADHLLYLQTMLEQILATSEHTWSDETLRFFPPLLRDFLIPRIDKRGVAIQAWQQVHCCSPNFLFFFHCVCFVDLQLCFSAVKTQMSLPENGIVQLSAIWFHYCIPYSVV